MLPNIFVITPNWNNFEKLLTHLKNNIIGKYNFIGIREYDLNDDNVEKLILFCKKNFQYVVIFKNYNLAKKHKIGIQLGFDEYITNKSLYIDFKLIGVSCHEYDNVDEILPSVDYITMSPVFDSISKPGYHGMGAYKFNQILQKHKIYKNKIFALGGIKNDNIQTIETKKIALCGKLF